MTSSIVGVVVALVDDVETIEIGIAWLVGATSRCERVRHRRRGRVGVDPRRNRRIEPSGVRKDLRAHVRR
ncbi:MAG: hypothetical protein ABI664_17050, partial [bacterium]